MGNREVSFHALKPLRLAYHRHLKVFAVNQYPSKVCRNVNCDKPDIISQAHWLCGPTPIHNRIENPMASGGEVNNANSCHQS